MKQSEIKRAAAAIIALRATEGIKTISSRQRYTRDYYEVQTATIKHKLTVYTNLRRQTAKTGFYLNAVSRDFD